MTKSLLKFFQFIEKVGESETDSPDVCLCSIC